MKLLSEMEIGTSGIVKSLKAEGKIKRRLYDMGITPGAKIVVKKFAPLRDPIEITLRGYELSLRLEEAKCIEMEEVK